MTQLRLALASDTFHPQVNGVTRTLTGLVKEAVSRGAEVRVFTTSDPHAVGGPEVTRFPSVPFWAYPQLRVAAPGARMTAELRRWRPTLIHAATPFGVGLAARGAARALGVPFVTSYHTSLSAYTKFYQLGALAEPCWSFLRWFHNSGRLTFVPSQPVADELTARGFASLRLWGRGVDCQRFNPLHRSMDLRRRLGFADDDIVVLYVGRLAREKGLADLLDAMRQRGASRERVRFLLVGDGPYEAELRARAPNDAVFTGRREGAELAALYASSDVFVFPSVTDTFGNVLLEAIASGLPVVAADARATRTLVGPADAMFYAAMDSAALVAALALLAVNASDRKRRSNLGLREAPRRSWQRVFDDLFSAYLEVLRWPVSLPETESPRAA